MSNPVFDPSLGVGFLPSRRAFLGGAGALVALPALEALAPRAAWGAEPARRLVAFFVPCGFWMPTWAPKGEGTAWALSPTLEPLAPFKPKLSVLSGLDNLPAREPEGKGDHACGTAGFLTCRRAEKLPHGGFRLGVSMDQVAAAQLGRATRIRSLQLGVNADSPVCDPGYSCAYINNISWASESQPLPKTARPDLVFDRLFEGLSPDDDRAARAERRARRTSVLDYVLEQTQRLRGRLGAGDRRKLDEYATGIRDLESEIQAAAPLCSAGDRPRATPEIPDRIRQMLDLIVLAFRCDATRVVSFMMGNGFEGGLNFPFLGIGSNHHPISHHQSRAENTTRLEKIDRWEVTQLAYLLERMDAVPEGEGTLLDASAVFFSSEIEDGNSHSHTNLPIVVAGSAGGRLVTGRHTKFAKLPVANLFVSLLRAVGAQVDAFGADGTGPLPGIAT